MASNQHSDDFTPQQAELFKNGDAANVGLTLSETCRMVLKAIASLKVTVVLFGLAFLLVLFGTVAQTRMDISGVIDGYFRTIIAHVTIQHLLPQSFFPKFQNVSGSFYFPGGWMIGGLMAINLLAAHLIRFKIQAKGTRLAAGLMTILLGTVLTAYVIALGSNKDGVQGVSMISFSSLWIVIQASLAATWLGMAYTLFRLDPRRTLEFWSLVASLTGLGTLLGWIFIGGESVSLNDSSMRIVWQLIKGGLAGVVLLAGCVLVFKKRAGVVLLHAGIGLVMFNELFVGLSAREGIMEITEGQTINFVQDLDAVELAVIDPSHKDQDDVVVIPASFFKADAQIKHDDLPFDIRVIEYMENSNVVDARNDPKNIATAGMGRFQKAISKPLVAATDRNSTINIASSYIEIVDKKNRKKSLGKYLVTQHLIPDSVVVGNKKYQIALRFKRLYRPFSMHLAEFHFGKYAGTSKPKDFRSKLQLVDTHRKIKQDVEIWMNNPFRFAGETFYQTGYDRDRKTGKWLTKLQVVTNTGWMIPYVSCMIVGVGMLAHFSVILLRFLRRRADSTAAASVASSPVSEQKKAPHGPEMNPSARLEKKLAIVLPIVFVLFAGVLIAYKAKPATDTEDEMQTIEFGRLPAMFGGRVQPLDTVARTYLRAVSDRETFSDSEGNRRPAIDWLLDVISGSDVAMQHDVIRIQNLDLLNTLGLERIKRFRYSLEDILKKWPDTLKQATQAQGIEQSKRSIHQKKLLELNDKIHHIERLLEAFSVPIIRINSEHTEKDLEREKARRTFMVKQGRPMPWVIPPIEPEGEWRALRHAVIDLIDQQSSDRADEATTTMLSMLRSYKEGNAKEFNTSLEKYRKLIGEKSPENFSPKKTSFEAYYNHFAPLDLALVMYISAFVLAALSWLVWSRPLGRTSFWVIVLALGVQTFALIARMIISGRPGVVVTDLYSSAVFISWGCVILGLVLEIVYRIGIGNIVACLTGALALFIAPSLVQQGKDTFAPLQAVLDTNFWLATHVTCITLGYATTFLAGGLGIMYVILGVATPSLTPKIGKDLYRMTYGTICFAIFFSFIGTVLGGLWADDSWGRFWGWDPKENGALLIVLWNAIALHARWGGMVKDRGFAILVMFGNIVTAWSWFAVNELETGLHSYGRTEGVMFAFWTCSAVQLAVMGIGMIPRNHWWSSVGQDNARGAKSDGVALDAKVL